MNEFELAMTLKIYPDKNPAQDMLVLANKIHTFLTNLQIIIKCYFTVLIAFYIAFICDWLLHCRF